MTKARSHARVTPVHRPLQCILVSAAVSLLGLSACVDTLPEDSLARDSGLGGNGGGVDASTPVCNSVAVPPANGWGEGPVWSEEQFLACRMACPEANPDCLQDKCMDSKRFLACTLDAAAACSTQPGAECREGWVEFGCCLDSKCGESSDEQCRGEMCGDLDEAAVTCTLGTPRCVGEANKVCLAGQEDRDGSVDGGDGGPSASAGDAQSPTPKGRLSRLSWVATALR